MSTPLGNNNELQLNVTKRCSPNSCNCRPMPKDLTVQRDQVPNAKDFIACTHESDAEFLLRRYIGGYVNWLPNHIHNVTKVSVYYWKKADTKPLLLKVERTIGGEEYYYNYPNEKQGDGRIVWTSSPEPSIELKERLDDRNCGVNRAIVYDLTNNYTDASSSVTIGGTRSDCRTQIRTITVNTPASITESPDGYTVKEYDINSAENNTRISRVTFGKNVDTSIDPPLEATSKIRVYEWKYASNIPLLIEFVKNGKQGSTWFENTHQKSTEWKRVSGTGGFYNEKDGKEDPQPALTTKLDEVNCNVNNVVHINVLERPEGSNAVKEYCHDAHKENKRIKVQEVSNSGKELINYKAYEHVPNVNASGGTIQNFHISGFTKGTAEIGFGRELDLPILDATRVIVYFCNSRFFDPLLIYVQDAKPHDKQWFKKTGDSWTAVDQAPSNPTSYTEILEILDNIQSSCKPPKVTIKIDERGPDYKDTPGSGRTINVAKNDHKEDALTGFTEYTHKVVGRQNSYFTLKHINFGTGQATDFGTPTPKVSSVSVYYWTALEKANKSESRPLLVKVSLHGGGEKWYKNTDKDNNLKWEAVSTDHVSGENLEKKLILLNCRLNSVTVIDIGKKPKDEPYCHDPDSTIGENTHNPLIKVDDITNEDPTYKDNIGRFVVYEHIVDPTISGQRSFRTNFHISGFQNTNRTQASIPLKVDLPMPLLDVTKFLVFWCSSGDTGKPLLFYVEYNGNSKEWFKKPPRETEPWIKLDDGKKPPSAENTKVIWDILNSYDTECKFKWWHIITGTAGGGATGGVGYWAYKGFEWFFMAPWPRLM